jgi:hypothetical protein
VRCEKGSASVEQAGLAALIALLLLTAIAAVAADGEIEPGRDLGGTIARRLACAPADTTRWLPPTAGLWPGSPAPLRRSRPPYPALRVCCWSRSTSAVAGARAAPWPPDRT